MKATKIAMLSCAPEGLLALKENQPSEEIKSLKQLHYDGYEQLQISGDHYRFNDGVKLVANTSSKRYEGWKATHLAFRENCLANSGWEYFPVTLICENQEVVLEDLERDDPIEGMHYLSGFRKINEKHPELPILVEFKEKTKNKTVELWVIGAEVYTAPIDISPEDALTLIRVSELETEKKLSRLRNQIEVSENCNAADSRKPIPDEIQLFVWNRDGGCCVQCGSKESLEFDHIIPFSKGGANTARNLQLLCEHCNRSKGSKIGG